MLASCQLAELEALHISTSATVLVLPRIERGLFRFYTGAVTCNWKCKQSKRQHKAVRSSGTPYLVVDLEDT